MGTGGRCGEFEGCERSDGCSAAVLARTMMSCDGWTMSRADGGDQRAA